MPNPFRSNWRAKYRELKVDSVQADETPEQRVERWKSKAKAEEKPPAVVVIRRRNRE